MVTLVSTVIVASLAGSIHCAGMCGPLVAFVLNPLDRPGTPRAALHVLYHAARLLAYALIGAMAGALGAMLDLTGGAIGVQRTAAVLAGAVIAITGIATLLRYLGVTIPMGQTPRPLARLAQTVQKLALSFQPLPRAALFGALTALLPCGWLYVFGVTAAGTGSPLAGAAVMAAFWAGTVPWLLAVGVGTQLLTRLVGGRMPVVTAVVLIALGAMTIAGRTTVPAGAFAALGSHDKAPESLPCCHEHGE